MHQTNFIHVKLKCWMKNRRVIYKGCFELKQILFTVSDGSSEASIQWNLSATTTSIITFITRDLSNKVF